MPKTSTEKSKDLRERRARARQKEMRGVWVTDAEEKKLKPEVRAMIKDMRKGT